MEVKYINFIVYVIIFTLFGAFQTGLGPIVIYFGLATGKDQTYYSFVYLAKALGYIIGGSFIKNLASKYNYHTIYQWIIIICGLSLILSSFSFDFFNLFITLLIASSCGCLITILNNLCIFELFQGEKVGVWIQIHYIFFGVGGIIGPIIVVLFQSTALRIIGILVLIMIIPFAYLPSPTMSSSIEPKLQKEQRPFLSGSAEVYLCLLAFLHLSSQIGFANWIPAYAFKAGITDEDQSSQFSSLFWMVNVVFRVLSLFWKGTVEFHLRLLFRLLALSSFIILFLQIIGQIYLTCLFGAISLGACFSAMYALFFSIGNEYGYALSPSNNANITMSSVLGEGIIVMPIGYAMAFFGHEILILIIVIMNLIMLAVFESAVSHMGKDCQQKNKSKILISLIQTAEYQDRIRIYND